VVDMAQRVMALPQAGLYSPMANALTPQEKTHPGTWAGAQPNENRERTKGRVQEDLSPCMTRPKRI
jgi:hypothetical protein